MEPTRPILLISPWPSRNNGVAWYTGKYKEALERHGRRVETRRMVFWQEKSTFWKWVSFLRDVDRIRPSSVLIQHTPTGSGPLLPWFLGRLRYRGLRSVVVSHETPGTYARHLDRLPPARAAYLAWEKAIARRASAFVVHTRLHAQEMESLCAPATAVIPHPILAMPDRPVQHVPSTLGLFGQIGSKKGHDLVVDAIQTRPPGAFPPLEIWGAPGVGQEKYLEELKRRVRPEYASHIRFCGYMPDDGKVEAFGRMHLALFPYRWISQSCAQTEALAHGIPYLASDIPFFRDFQATHGCGDVFPTENVEELASAIERALARPDRWTESDFARLYGSLSVERCSARLLELLEAP
ncbi:MAG TPA: glycosyltransferase [Fibrobacteria bacterium]|nr:glycosyltransferase [Fibrobacteria bacterium]HOX50336.1 glycosyltransferase [Fibrobacteria bacterium]